MMKTALKSARTFLSMARYSGEDMFARVYTIKGKQEKNDKGAFYIPIITFKRRCTDEEYAAAKSAFDSLYRRKDDIDVELNEAAPAAAAEEGSTQQ
jgi:hypothetical protein